MWVIERFAEQTHTPLVFSDDYAAAEFVEFAVYMVRNRNTGSSNDLVKAKKALIEAIVAIGEVNRRLEKESQQLEAKQYQLSNMQRQIRRKYGTTQNRRKSSEEKGLERLKADVAAEVIRLERQKQAREKILGGVKSAFDLALNEGNKIANQLTESMEASPTSSSVSVSGRARRASQPVPPSQVVHVYGGSLFYKSAGFFCSACNGRQIRWAGKPYCSKVDENGKPVKAPPEYRVDLLDVQKWLQAELSEAHELLSQPNHLQLWYDLANSHSGLAVAIRSNHLHKRGTGPTDAAEQIVTPTADQLRFDHWPTDQGAHPPYDLPYVIGTLASELGDNASVQEYRDYFLKHIHKPYPAEEDEASEAGSVDHLEVLDQLAWAIVVESALLNYRLNEDVRKVAVSKGCGYLSPDQQVLSYFLPEAAANPEFVLSEEYYTATRSFQEYVRCRWPIHVFAIDPREQDQNVADESLRRRELQFALALGFVSGQINANSLTNYSRELETEVRTISLIDPCAVNEPYLELAPYGYL